MLSVEYCFFAVSLLYVAVTVTFLLVGAVVLAFTVGALGAVLSMFVTLTVVTLEILPTASMPRK